MKKADEKIKKMVETEERYKSVRGFMKLWNEWREFYFDLPPMEPKTRGQLTSIEKAMQFCKENDYSLTMMIACAHKAHIKRTVKPSFSCIVSYGADYYEKFYDDVIADIDLAEYEEKSRR